MEIISNGSRSAGSELATVEELLDLLAREPLDPRFERYSNFVERLGGGEWQVFGNFFNLSHVFNIRGGREELKPLIQAIDANQASDAYAAVRRTLALPPRQSVKLWPSEELTDG